MVKGIFGIVVSLLILGSVLLWTCTGNHRAKNWGGTTTIELPKGQKLVNITWKDESIWYLSRPMEINEIPTTWRFHEKSPKDILNGTVIIKESK